MTLFFLRFHPYRGRLLNFVLSTLRLSPDCVCRVDLPTRLPFCFIRGQLGFLQICMQASKCACMKCICNPPTCLTLPVFQHDIHIRQKLPMARTIMNRDQDDQSCMPRHGADPFSLHGCSFFLPYTCLVLFFFFSSFFLMSGSGLNPK